MINRTHTLVMRPIFFSCVIGFGAAIICFLWWGGTGFAGDLTWPIRGAEWFLAGLSPYGIPLSPLPYGRYAPYLFYPLPAILILVPLTLFETGLAGALFAGLSSGLMSYGLIKTDNGWRLPYIFLSAPYWMALVYVQWSPLLIAAMVLPSSLGFVMICKPTLGLAAWVYRPTTRGTLVAAIFLLSSFFIMPSWPSAWIDNSRHNLHHIPLLVMPGLLLVFSALRWRTREGRLLLALSVVPQRLLLYDQLFLWLIPNSHRQALIVSILSWIPRAVTPPDTLPSLWLVISCLYLPELFIVMLQWYQDSEAR